MELTLHTTEIIGNLALKYPEPSCKITNKEILDTIEKATNDDNLRELFLEVIKSKM